MDYDNFTTFTVALEEAIAWVTFDYPPVNVQGLPMLADLNRLAQKLEADRQVKVVVFQSANTVARVDKSCIEALLTK